MPHSALTPETAFQPSTAPAETPLFAFAQAAPRFGEQQQYKRLIETEATRQGIPIAHLADRLAIRRTKLHKIIRQTNPLGENLRDQLFEVLGIDHVRAKVCVALLCNYEAYSEPSMILVTEALKGFYCEVVTCRRGEIHVDLRPAIIHAALGKAYEALLSHQERVLEHEQNLLG